MGERVRIEGSGGRESAFGLALSQSDQVSEVQVYPGNAGTSGGQGKFVSELSGEPDLIIIGPEDAIISGRVDQLEAQGYKGRVLGIHQGSSFLEASKIQAAAAMERWGIPHPESHVINNWTEAANFTFGRSPEDYVIKADKPGAGKAVVLPKTHEEANAVLYGMLMGRLFGGAGRNAVQIQERLDGAEVSVFTISDGKKYYELPGHAQDHKRLKDGDEGPNTGGMGAYSPVPETVLSEYQRLAIRETIDQTYDGLHREGHDAQGILYFSFMLSEKHDGQPLLIEYNVRLGDPEAQVILPLLDRYGLDVYDLLRSAAAGSLQPECFAVPDSKLLGHAALTVCLAAGNYPDEPQIGDVIYGLDQPHDAILHYAAAKKQEDNTIQTAGGRVLYVTGVGDNIDLAARQAYAAIGRDNNGVYFDGMQYRKDIGRQAR